MMKAKDGNGTFGAEFIESVEAGVIAAGATDFGRTLLMAPSPDPSPDAQKKEITF